MNVRNENSSLRYDELAAVLRQRIASGTYAVGSKLPSEAELTEDTGFSRSTVRHALQILVDEGLISKSKGRGAFVESAPIIDDESFVFSSFTAALEQIGSEVATRVVDAGLAKAPDGVCDYLHTNIDEQHVKIVRLRYLDNEPLCLETTYLPKAYESIISGNLTGSLYKQLREDFNVIPAGGHKTFEICFATQNEAFLLGVEKGTPLMLVTDFVLSGSGTPLHVSKRALRTDKSKYTEPLGTPSAKLAT